MRVSVQEAPFDLASKAARFAAGEGDMGAIVTFTGVVRDLPDDPLEAMEIEHYPGMTEAALTRSQSRRWRGLTWGCAGDPPLWALVPGEMIMMVATAAPHRKNAFEAAEFLMDYLKSRAPFWKREITAQG